VMIALQATEEETLAALADAGSQGVWTARGISIAQGVSIAALNTPSSTVISGDEAAVTAVAARLADQGRKTRRLNTSHAFHSAHMDPVLDASLAVAGPLTSPPPRIPVISNITGQLADRLTDPGYWTDHIRQAVHFHQGIAELDRQQVTTYLELG